MRSSKITPKWRATAPFNSWLRAMSYMSAGYFACLNNGLSLTTGTDLQYNVFI